MNPTSEPKARRAGVPAGLGLPKISKTKATVTLRLELVGPPAEQFQHYCRAYREVHGEEIDQAMLASHMLDAWMAGDKSFQSWLKTNAREAA